MATKDHVARRLRAIQRAHNFSPTVGAAQLRGKVATNAYARFDELLRLARKLGVRVPHDPFGLAPTRRHVPVTERPVHVYFARKEGTTFYKLGSSVCPQMRVRAVQTGNDGSLRLVYVVQGVDGRSVERQLKRALRRFKTRDRSSGIKGEWFDLTATQVRLLVRSLRAGEAVAVAVRASEKGKC